MNCTIDWYVEPESVGKAQFFPTLQDARAFAKEYSKKHKNEDVYVYAMFQETYRNGKKEQEKIMRDSLFKYL